MSGHDREIEYVFGAMGRAGDRMPAGWQHGFWVGSAWNVAELLVDARRLLTVEQKTVLLGAGAMMLRQAIIEGEGKSMADLVLSRARQNGGGK